MAAEDALPGYFAILKGTRNAKYIDMKNVNVQFDYGAEESMLWHLHDRTKEPSIKSDWALTFTRLDLKAELAKRMLERCRFCERRCLVNRMEGNTGHCKVSKAKVASEFVHFGEEPELVPSYTIFFASCTFHCVFCQNWDISQSAESGIYIEPRVLARMIEAKTDIRNVNWVGGDPTPNLSYILEVLTFCDRNLPQVWNSNMYLSEEAMRLLKGVIDVYLTDFKYGNDDCAKRLSGVDDYFTIVSRNHELASAQGELLIRHLVIPNHFDCCTKPVFAWIHDNLDDARVNVMAQYRPEYKAKEHDELAQSLSVREFRAAINHAKALDLNLVER